MNSRVFYTLIRLAVVCAALGLAAGCDDVSTAELKTPVYKTGLKDSDDNKTSAFRKDFPLQAASYDRNNESTFMSKYKGSVNFMKNDDVDPLPEGYKQAAQPTSRTCGSAIPSCTNTVKRAATRMRSTTS